MAAPQPLKLTKRAVDSLHVSSGDTVVWDRDLPGFGVRVYASGRKVWCVQVRGPSGKPRRRTLGRFGEVTPEKARRDAVIAIDRIKRGLSPDPPLEAPEPTVLDLAERYMEFHVRVNCKPRTVASFESLVRVHIVPGLGHIRLSELERSHISGLHHRLRMTPFQANLVVKVLSGMFRLAEAWEMIPPGRDLCRSVRPYREKPRERFLSSDEYGRLGDALDKAEMDGSVYLPAIHAIRLLLLTGCRKDEIRTLKWDDIDRSSGMMHLRDGKTGLRHVPLAPAVLAVLNEIPRIDGNPWVIAGNGPEDHLGTGSLDYHWQKIRSLAKLEKVRLHDLRHSYASRALALGEGLPMIGELLGHRKVETTA
ncbi:MAG: tyrosine-type recombinase/integrase, partial [Gammaproteobacteria bacterium]|nr:tyrosine-type recombinase/integrase [Gammaproteobacteria bacterium]